jgi:hypothetical protein
MRRYRRYGLTWIVTVIVVAAGWFAFTGDSFGAFSSATPQTVCVLTGTPGPGVVDVKALGCSPAGVGTPAVADGLSITLTLSSDQAGPQDIVVELRDAAGQPVDDATVTLINRHLEMNMGDSVRKLVHDRDGRYLGDRVGMGMGGRWQTEIRVSRPSHPTVTFIFAVSLHGIE